MTKHQFTAKLGLSNFRAVPHEVHVEPWANDYTLMPEEELEVVAFGDTAEPSFHVREWEGASQVYCENTVDFQVLQNGNKLECGHNRQDNSPFNPPVKE